MDHRRPIELTIVFDPDKNIGTLKWKPNPVGRKPAKYRIYGSDEKGFSIADEPFKAVVGTSKDVPSALRRISLRKSRRPRPR